MARGDVISSALASVSASVCATIQPSASAEWVVKNIYYGGAVGFYVYDGTNAILFDSDGSAGGRFGCNILLTNTRYLVIKNTSAGAIYIGYDGLVLK